MPCRTLKVIAGTLNCTQKETGRQCGLHNRDARWVNLGTPIMVYATTFWTNCNFQVVFKDNPYRLCCSNLNRKWLRHEWSWARPPSLGRSAIDTLDESVQRFSLVMTTTCFSNSSCEFRKTPKLCINSVQGSDTPSGVRDDISPDPGGGEDKNPEPLHLARIVKTGPSQSRSLQSPGTQPVLRHLPD